MADPAYAPHEHLVAPARHRPQLWRLFAGLVVVVAIMALLNRVAYGVLTALAPDLFLAGGAAPGAEPGSGMGNTPASMLVLLGSFGFTIIGVAVAVRLLQDRTLGQVIGPLPLALRQFWRVARVLAAIGLLILVLPPYDMGVELRQNLRLGLWLILLPVSLLAVLIQTGAEEILFRGYLQQSLAARFRNPLIWMGGPAVLFALGHYLPSEAGDNALLIAVWSGMFGLVTADLTARAGTLGPAIAVHLFNNVTALLVVALPDSLSGLALYTLPFGMSDTGVLRAWLAVDFVMMLVSWLAARIVIAR
ncbi:CPBP family intramembrane metalloprotease [Rhodobacteraceae bacterium F11138]|nr:CPBP family intramembrane metalloprotease [Rhodobacteraceae bacterium F11138]